MTNPLLKITPLGGVGQIGSNLTLFKHKSETIIVDCGILFPKEQCFEINYLIPDLDFIEQVPTRIIITHGHEDHIGAIPHLIQKFPNIEIHAPRFALELIKRKLYLNDLSHQVKLYRSPNIFKFGDFNIHPIQVNHSIPDTYGLLFATKNNSHAIFFASDYKIDFNSPYEEPFAFKKLNNLTANISKKIMLSDSTNILSEGKTPSEADLLGDFDNIFEDATGRIFITVFSSNIHRVQTILNTAKKHNRKVFLHGRSVQAYVQVAKDAGILDVNQSQLIDEYKPKKTADSKIVVILTGSQGEFRGALRRVSVGEDSTFTIKKGDLFLFSSKAIPGNEHNINTIVNSLTLAGASVLTARDKLIHVSGHPGRDDLKTTYDTFRPTDIVPIHGESFFLQRHVDFIKEFYPQVTPHLLTNYDSLVVTDDKIFVEKGEGIRPVLIHGKRVPIERSSISERRKIATQGLIIISIGTKSNILDSSRIMISFHGLPVSCHSRLEELDGLVTMKINSIGKNYNIEEATESIRISARKFFHTDLGYKPIAIVHIV